MKVLEIKNNLVKVSYDIEDKLVLAGFTVIEDEKTPYVGQIVSLKADNGETYAIVKLLFTFDTEGIVKNYDGSIPKLNATVNKLTCPELLDILPVEKPLKIGKIAQQNFLLNIDTSILSNNLLICSDSAKNTAMLVSNFVKQCENDAESSVVFDVDGKYNDFKKLVFGTHFKLPLNFETINFIYGNDLNDIDPTSKAVIQDIFLEVQEYTRTIPDKFIPFETFINVVDQQYAESGIPELALLKNKLLKYKEENVFAESKYEILSLREYIKDNYTVVLDISNVDAKLQREIIFYVYQTLEDMDSKIYSFVKVNDQNSDKKLLKQLLQENKISTTIICNHNFKYVYELKEKSDNLILFAPETTQHDFATYNTFLNKLNHDEFIIWGSSTQRIPLIVELAPIEIIKEEPEAPQPEQIQVLPQPTPDDNAPKTEISETESNKGESSKIIAAGSDFTSNEDTYTDLSDDIERTPQEEEDYSALSKEEPEPTSDEDDFEQELNKSVEENLIDEPELTISEEASTNNFFTEAELQQQPEVEANSEKLIKTEPEILDSQEEIIMPDGEIIEEDEIYEESSRQLDEMPEQDLHEGNAEYIEENELQDSSNEDESINLPEPTIDDRIEEDLPEIKVEEDIFENSDENFTQSPFENEIYPEPAPLMNEDAYNSDTIENIIEEPVEGDVLTEDDLNFIDDINHGDSEILEPVVSELDENFDSSNSQSQANDENPQVVPVYAAKTPVTNQSFEQGDRVSHPKYGEGVVEKMIKYGNKSLCSINFINVGRRLLDPAISEISKL